MQDLNLKTELLKSVQISFAKLFLSGDNSVNIETRHLKFCMLILNTIMERTVSQIFILGPSSYFMLFRK